MLTVFLTIPSKPVSSVMPAVSVIVPTHDRPEFLRRALASISRQTYSPSEVIVVDDHSAAPVERIVTETLQEAPASARVIRHARNRGAAAARNTGIDAAEGTILAFLDDDDRWSPRTLERYVETFDGAPEDVGLVTVGARMVDGAGHVIGRNKPRFDGDPLPSLARGALAGSFSRFAVRENAVRAAGHLDERLPSWQDWDWQFRLARHCRFAAVPALLVERTRGDHGQLTDDFRERRDVSYPILRDRHRPVLAARGGGLENRFLGTLARSLGSSALAAGHYAAAITWLLRSLRHDPRQPETYAYLAAALGGPLTFRSARWLKQACYRALPAARRPRSVPPEPGHG